MSQSRAKRLATKLLGWLALPVFLFLFLRWFERANVYQPTRRHDVTPAELTLEFKDVNLRTSDGTALHAWFFPAARKTKASPAAVLIAHGNGGNISHRFSLYTLLLELGLDVLAFDYRGYGLSEGSPSESGTYDDAGTARQWLIDQGYPADHIVILGESLGGGVAAEIAARETVGALILLSTFTSIPDVGAELFPFLPVRTISKIRYDTLSKLDRVRAPVLILHSRDDGLIGFHHAERNFAAAREPKVLGEIQGSHNDAMDEDREGILRLVREFLTQQGILGTSVDSPRGTHGSSTNPRPPIP
ncbi:MAG: alpha/beta hydrolase [Verrucomicrobia bacterium]|nr:alpha/beta hydrolase [Verrucomicrobiota bacterium]